MIEACRIIPEAPSSSRFYTGEGILEFFVLKGLDWHIRLMISDRCVHFSASNLTTKGMAN